MAPAHARRPLTTRTASRDDLRSLWDFESQLKALGHFPTHYENTEHLKRHFRDQLQALRREGKL